MINLSRFWFLSRFCLKAEGRRKEDKILILRRAIASTSHLKRQNCLNICNTVYLQKWVENIQAADYNGMGTIHNILVEGQACNHILKSLISPFKAFKWIIAGTQRPFFIAVSLLDMCISEVLQNELQSFLEKNSFPKFSCMFLNPNNFFQFEF